MILVDIGNSGLRAVRTDDSSPLLEQNIWRLSWPANLLVREKSVPVQQPSINHKWCEQDDREAFAWLIRSIQPKNSETWIISSVKQSALEQLWAACDAENINCEFRKLAHSDLPFQVDVEAPEKVGMDRLLSSWEAWHVINVDLKETVARHETVTDAMCDGTQPVITVQAGTAVTVDMMSADGAFRGGAIMPGLGLSLQLLAAGTEQLPWIANAEVTALPMLPGKNTSQAIAAGVHACLSGGATFLINRYRQELNLGNIPVIVTGGDSQLLKPFIQPPCMAIEHMVLRGLNRLISIKKLA